MLLTNPLTPVWSSTCYLLLITPVHTQAATLVTPVYTSDGERRDVHLRPMEIEHPMGGISSSACSYRAATDQRVSGEPPSWSSDHILMGRSLTYHCSARLYDGETVIDAHWRRTVHGGPNKTEHSAVFIRTPAVMRRSKYHRCVQCPVSDVGVCSAVRHAAGMQSIRLAGVWPAEAN